MTLKLTSEGLGAMFNDSGMSHGSHGSLKTGKVFEFEKNNSRLWKNFDFCKNFNKPGKVLDFDQPVIFCWIDLEKRCAAATASD